MIITKSSAILRPASRVRQLEIEVEKVAVVLVGVLRAGALQRHGAAAGEQGASGRPPAPAAERGDPGGLAQVVVQAQRLRLRAAEAPEQLEISTPATSTAAKHIHILRKSPLQIETPISEGNGTWQCPWAW